MLKAPRVDAGATPRGGIQRSSKTMSSLKEAEEIAKLGEQLFDGKLSVMGGGGVTNASFLQGKEQIAAARSNASKARKSVLSEQVQRAEREAELKRMEEEVEAQARIQTIQDHAELRDSLCDTTRRQKIDDTSKRALKQLQQLSDFLNLDRADPQLASVQNVSCLGPPLNLEKEIQKRLVPHNLRPSEMFRSNLAAMDHLIEVVSAIQAPSVEQLDDEERELLSEAQHNSEAVKILMSQCTCAARLDTAIRDAETATAIKTRMECTNLFAKLTVAAANMIRSLETLVYEKDQYIDEVTASNQMMVKKYDSLLHDFSIMEKETTQRLKELESEEMKKKVGGGGGAGGGKQASAVHHNSLQAASPSPMLSNTSMTHTTMLTSLSQVPGSVQMLGKHATVMRQHEFLEREARVLQRYRELFQVLPQDNPCPAGAGGLNCAGGNNNNTLSRSTTIVGPVASFRDLPSEGSVSFAPSRGGPRKGGDDTALALSHVLEEEFALDVHMKPNEKRTSAEWVQKMRERILRMRRQEQNARNLECQLMALHDKPQKTSELIHKGMQTLKEEEVVGSPAWEKKYTAMVLAQERALRPAVQQTAATREIFHSDVMFKAELRKSGFDALHGVPAPVADQLESVLGSLKDMMVSVDYARVAAIEHLSGLLKDEQAMTKCNALHQQLETDIDDELYNFRRALQELKGAVLETLKPRVFSINPVGADHRRRKMLFPLPGEETGEEPNEDSMNVELLEGLCTRFTRWAKETFHVVLPRDDDSDPAVLGVVRSAIRRVDTLLDAVSELPVTVDASAVGGAGGKKGRRGGGPSSGAESQDLMDTRNAVGSSVGMTLIDASQLIQVIRSTIPVALPKSIQEGVTNPPPDEWVTWNDVVLQLKKLSEWLKGTCSSVETFRIETAAKKQQQQAAALQQPVTLDFPSPQTTGPDADDADEDAGNRVAAASSPTAAGGKKAVKKKSSLSSEKQAKTSRKPQKAGATEDMTDENQPIAPPTGPVVSPWDEENPLTANVQLLAVSMRDVMFRLTKAISKTQFKVAKIPSDTMREAIMLEHQFASEDVGKWSTEKLALLISRVIDWADVMGDIIALPYEMNKNVQAEEVTEAASPLKHVPSTVFSSRKKSLSSDDGTVPPPVMTSPPVTSMSSSTNRRGSDFHERVLDRVTPETATITHRSSGNDEQTHHPAAATTTRRSVTTDEKKPSTEHSLSSSVRRGGVSPDGSSISLVKASYRAAAAAEEREGDHQDSAIQAELRPQKPHRHISPSSRSDGSRTPRVPPMTSFTATETKANTNDADVSRTVIVDDERCPSTSSPPQDQDNDIHPHQVTSVPSTFVDHDRAVEETSYRDSSGHDPDETLRLESSQRKSSRVASVSHTVNRDTDERPYDDAERHMMMDVPADLTLLNDKQEAAALTTEHLTSALSNDNSSLLQQEQQQQAQEQRHQHQQQVHELLEGEEEEAQVLCLPSSDESIAIPTAKRLSASSVTAAPPTPRVISASSHAPSSKKPTTLGSSSHHRAATTNTNIVSPRDNNNHSSNEPILHHQSKTTAAKTTGMAAAAVATSPVERSSETPPNVGAAVSPPHQPSSSTQRQYQEAPLKSPTAVVIKALKSPTSIAVKGGQQPPAVASSSLEDAIGTRIAHSVSPHHTVGTATVVGSTSAASAVSAGGSTTAVGGSPIRSMLGDALKLIDPSSSPPPPATTASLGDCLVLPSSPLRRTLEEEQQERDAEKLEEEEDAAAIQKAVLSLYPELAAEMNELQVSKQIVQQRAVVSNRKATSFAIQAAHALCCELIDVFDLGDAITPQIKSHLEHGDGNFTRIAVEIHEAFRQQRENVTVVGNEKMQQMEVERACLVEDLEIARQEQERLKRTVQRLEEEKEMWDEEREELLHAISQKSSSGLPTPLPSALSLPHQYRSGGRDFSEGGGGGGDATPEPCQQQLPLSHHHHKQQPQSTSPTNHHTTTENGAVSQVTPPIPTQVVIGGGASALDDLANIRRHHKYKRALEKDSVVSTLVLSCMKRMAEELNAAEKSALLHELIGPTVIAMHRALVPLFATEMFRRLRIHSRFALKDPLQAVEDAQAAALQSLAEEGRFAKGKRAASIAAEARRKSQQPSIPNVAHLLDFDKELVSTVYEMLKEDSAAAREKMKATFQRVKLRVEMKRAQHQFLRRQEAMSNGKGDFNPQQLVKDKEFLARREAALHERMMWIEEQQEKIRQRQQRAWELAQQNRTPLPLHPVLLFITEADAGRASTRGGDAAVGPNNTEGAQAYMDEFRERIGLWLNHAKSSMLTTKKLDTPVYHPDRALSSSSSPPPGSPLLSAAANDVLPSSSSLGGGTMTKWNSKSPLLTAAGMGVDEVFSSGGDDDDTKSDGYYRPSALHYSNKLLPVKEVDLDVDRELGRRRLQVHQSGGGLQSCSSLITRYPNVSLRAASLAQLQIQRQQQRVEHILRQTSVHQLSTASSHGLSTPPPRLAGVPSFSPISERSTGLPPIQQADPKGLGKADSPTPTCVSEPLASPVPFRGADAARVSTIGGTPSTMVPAAVAAAAAVGAVQQSYSLRSVVTPPPGPWENSGTSPRVEQQQQQPAPLAVKDSKMLLLRNRPQQHRLQPQSQLESSALGNITAVSEGPAVRLSGLGSTKAPKVK